MQGASAVCAKRRNSRDVAQEIQKDLLASARAAARSGDDIRPGSDKFWAITLQHFVSVAQLLDMVQSEAEEEKQAKLTSGEQRYCIVCNEEIVKKFVRGRWPIYCEDCKLADRTI